MFIRLVFGDGRGNSHKTCNRCAGLRNKINAKAREVDFCGVAFGCLADWFTERFELSGTFAEVIAKGNELLG